MMLVLAMTTAGCASDGGDDTTTTTSSTTSTTEPQQAAWTECVNDDEGFRVEHPPEWSTNDGDVMAPCSLFDPEPIELEAGTEIPDDIAVVIIIESVPFETVTETVGEETLDQQERTVDGRSALRQELRSTGVGLAPEGRDRTRWLVDLDDRTLSAYSSDVGDPPYGEKVEVLDRMVESLRVTDPGDGPTTTVPDDEGLDPIGEPTTDTMQSDEFPTHGSEVALLTEVRSARHDGFERIVFEFDGDEPPSYRIGYVDAPITEPGSGREVEVAGSDHLEVRLQPASGVDLSGTEARETYRGPDRRDLAPLGSAHELVFVGDFEANMAWVVGTDRRAPYAAAFLRDPLRLVVDVLDP